MAIYRAVSCRNIAEILSSDRLSNQIVFTGNSGNILSVPKGIFFIEFLQAESGGSLTIEDGNGTIIATGLTEFSQDYSPLRCDRGVTITGDIALVKGFAIEDIFV